MAILTVNDVAARYHITKAGVYNFCKKGILPYGLKLRASRRWNSDELDAFDAEQTRRKN